MTEKYEEFKEWFKHHPTDEDELDLVFAIGNLFKEFEKHYEEKKKEEQIKQIIRDSIISVPLYPVNNICKDELYCSDALVNKLYNELKRKDLIK